MAVQEHENDIIVIYNPTNKPFTVKWGGVPRSLEPHQVAKYQRFLAEHIAKHLADFILQVKEYKYKKEHGREVNLMRNTKERQAVMRLIVRGVETYFLPPNAQGYQQAQDQVAPTEEERRSTLDLGEVDDDAIGANFDEIEIEQPIEAKRVDKDLSKQEIIEQLQVLGIPHSDRETKADLLKKLGVNPDAIDGVTIDDTSTAELPDGAVPAVPSA